MDFKKKTWLNIPDPNNLPEIPEGQDSLAVFDADNMNRIEDGIENNTNQLIDLYKSNVLKNINKHYWKRQKVELSTQLATSTQEISMYEVTSSGPYKTFPFYYSESIELSIDYDAQASRVALKNPQFQAYGKKSYEIYTGKYISLNSDGSSPIYYVEGVNSKAYSAQVDYFTVTARQVFDNITTLGETELIYADNIDAYPNGFYDNYWYVYMGTPENNILNGVKMQLIAYVGTGTYGANNPCSITFDFAPTVVYRTLATLTTGVNHMYCDELATEYEKGKGFGYRNVETTYADFWGKKSPDGKTLYWYYDWESNNSISSQYNSAGMTYYYLGIQF